MRERIIPPPIQTVDECQRCHGTRVLEGWQGGRMIVVKRCDC